MNHRKLLPYAAAFAAFLLIMVIGLGIGGMASARIDIAERQEVARYADEVVKAGSEMLLTLNNAHRPSCDEGNLRVLRQLKYRSPYISDIAVVDEANRVACTTTLGVVTPPLPVLTPEYSTIAEGQRIFITDHGRDYLAHEGRPITRGRLNRFQVTIAPYAIEKMRGGHFSAVGYIDDDRRLKVIRGAMTESGSTAELAELTGRNVDWYQNMRQWSWQHLALEMSFKVKSLPLIYFHRSPIFASNATSLEYKLVLLLASFLMAMLVHAITVSTVEKSAAMTHRIKRLLTAENLRCVYQPIVALDSGRIVGCEVLVRLQDGDVLSTPDQFLPAVLERGLAWQLDLLVVQRSLTELREKIPAGEPFEIALNLFPQNIRAEQLHALIHGQLGWDPKADFTINLEVIEQSYHDEMLIEIAELKRLGYRVCVDDFGTGFSNLGSVRKLQPHYLKIDRSFVFEMETASVRSSLIPEIVAIARATGAALIAEGIENEQQLNALRGLGVEFGQGYFLGRPMPLDNLMARVREQPGKVVDLADWREKAVT